MKWDNEIGLIAAARLAIEIEKPGSPGGLVDPRAGPAVADPGGGGTAAPH